jgi:sulfite exporter TauE/SafE
MKLGILLFVIGSILALYLSKVKIEKSFLSKVGIVIGILFIFYGLILIVQPSEDKYVKFTKTTISKDKNTTTNK